jgi:hypothetical protein
VEAGLRCEKAFDSKTISPVLTSISDTDGLLNSGSTANREKTLAAEVGSNAEALGVNANTAAVSSAERLMKLFINYLVTNYCDVCDQKYSLHNY